MTNLGMTNIADGPRAAKPADAKPMSTARSARGPAKNASNRVADIQSASARSKAAAPLPATGEAIGEMSAIAPLICNHVMIRMATRQLGQLFDGIVASTDLKATQCGMLMQIEALRTPTMKDLAKTLVMDLSALGHTLKPLIRDGYVTLVPDLSDRRSKRVALTMAGMAKMVDIKQLWREATVRFETALGMDRAVDLRATLAVVASDAFGQAFRKAKPGRT